MSETPAIQLLKGFCGLLFGSSLQEAKDIFGEPEQIQELNDEILNNKSLVYHYWDLGFSLFFDQNRNSVFCSVEIDNHNTVLFENKIFSLKEKELISLMKQNGFLLTDTETHTWGEKRLSFDTAGLDCYFENNRLVTVNFGVLDVAGEFSFSPN